MANQVRALIFPFLLLLAAGCTMHTTATRWNGRVGPDGEPVHVKSTTNIGFNLLVFIPLIGGTTIDRMIDTITADIAAEQGNRVRLIETTSENYWYGFPPFTWIITPVITTIAADYQPSPEALRKAREEEESEAKR